MRKIYTKTFVYFAEIQYIYNENKQSKYHYGHTELHVLFFNI